MVFTEFVRKHQARVKPCDCGAESQGFVEKPHSKTCSAQTSMNEVWEDWRNECRTTGAKWTWQVCPEDGVAKWEQN